MTFTEMMVADPDLILEIQSDKGFLSLFSERILFFFREFLKSLFQASFALRELQNNWNSLQFAFEHLMVNKNDDSKKNENNNVKKSEKMEKS